MNRSQLTELRCTSNQLLEISKFCNNLVSIEIVCVISEVYPSYVDVLKNNQTLERIKFTNCVEVVNHNFLNKIVKLVPNIKEVTMAPSCVDQTIIPYLPEGTKLIFVRRKIESKNSNKELSFDWVNYSNRLYSKEYNNFRFRK